MSENKSDTKTEPEIVTATLVVAESDVSPEIDSLASDPEHQFPRTASQKLKQLDKKTVLFAGYVFWAMIFISGGATAAVLLSRKKPDPPPSPTTPPTKEPSLPICSHNEIVTKLDTICTEEESADDGTSLSYHCYDTKEANSNRERLGSINYEYHTVGKGLGNELKIPTSFEGWLPGSGDPFVEFEFAGQDKPCNFNKADKFFEKIIAARATPCLDGDIRNRLKLMFGQNCNTESIANEKYETRCTALADPPTQASALYTFALDNDKNEQPEAFNMIYSGQDMNEIVIDLQFSELDTCTLDEATATPFKMLAPCESLHIDIMNRLDSMFGTAYYCREEKDHLGYFAYQCFDDGDDGPFVQYFYSFIGGAEHTPGLLAGFDQVVKLYHEHDYASCNITETDEWLEEVNGFFEFITR